MNKLTIIGNLTRDPELRSVQGREGMVSVCDFTVAVNRRQKNAQGQNEADFFRVTTWRGLADTCKKYLAKGRKVCVVGPVSCRTYTGNDGVTRASLEMTADDIEFLTPKDQQAAPAQQPEYQNVPAEQTGIPGTIDADDEDLPF